MRTIIYLVTQEEHFDCIGIPACFEPEAYASEETARAGVAELEKENGEYTGVYYDYEAITLHNQ